MLFYFKSDAGSAGERDWSADLGTVWEAKVEAVRTLGELLREDGPEFWANHPVQMTVADDEGLVLFRLDLGAHEAPCLGGNR